MFYTVATIHYYLHIQVRNDYLKKNFESLDLDTAIQLCCIEIRRFFKDMPQIALDKKSNFEYLEKEVGLHKFLPKNVISTTKPKLLRKLIQQHFKKYAVLQDLDCMFKFFEILKSVYRFDQERYRCALGVRINFEINIFAVFLNIFVSVRLVHSRRTGDRRTAGYQLHDGQRRAGELFTPIFVATLQTLQLCELFLCKLQSLNVFNLFQPTHMADFSHIQSLQTVVGDGAAPGRTGDKVQIFSVNLSKYFQFYNKYFCRRCYSCEWRAARSC